VCPLSNDQKRNKMKLIGIILIVLGIAFTIVSIVFLIKAIKEATKLKDKEIKIEFKYSESKKKENEL
jgi:uncharacterized protein YpmS